MVEYKHVAIAAIVFPLVTLFFLVLSVLIPPLRILLVPNVCLSFVLIWLHGLVAVVFGLTLIKKAAVRWKWAVPVIVLNLAAVVVWYWFKTTAIHYLGSL